MMYMRLFGFSDYRRVSIEFSHCKDYASHVPKNGMPMQMDRKTQRATLTFFAIGYDECHLRFSGVETPTADDVSYDLSKY